MSAASAKKRIAYALKKLIMTKWIRQSTSCKILNLFNLSIVSARCRFRIDLLGFATLKMSLYAYLLSR